MSEFENKEYKIFEMFKNNWALVTAGNLESYNSCTIGWGSMGTIWTRSGKGGQIITVYIHPARYTQEFMKKNDTFTVSFYPGNCKNKLAYMGTHTGRDEDKAVAAGLTPMAIDDSVTFEEAELTFVCRKIYAHQFAKEDIAEDVQEYYKNNPKVYPVDENGEWQSHWMYIGEIIDVLDKKVPRDPSPWSL